MPESTSGRGSAPRTERLADWASGLARSGAIPERVLVRAAHILIDDLAAAVGGRAEPEVAAVCALAERRGPVPEATLFANAPVRAERGWAAFANGVATSWLELDEGYRRATCHGGLYTVPAALAECQAEGATLGRTLTAIVTGYEVATRLARAYPAPRPPVLHPHATLAPVGAAAAVAAARGYDPPTMAASLTAAATLGMAGPFSHATSGALVRNAWAGIGAWTGFAAADLAAAGIGGADDGFGAVFADGLGHEVEIDELTDGLGERYAVEDGYHKVYACCQYAHSAVEAVLELRAGPLSSMEAEQVVSVLVETHPLALALDGTDPANVLAGKFSVPHSVAAALVAGSAEPEVFSGRLLRNAGVAAVRDRVLVRMHPDIGAPPHDRPARVTVELRDGTRHTAEARSARGGPDRPLSTRELIDKAGELTRGRFPRFAETAAFLLTGGLDADRPLDDVLSRFTEEPS